MADDQMLMSAEDLQKAWAPLIERNNQQYMKIKELERALEEKDREIDDLYEMINNYELQLRWAQSNEND